jgi:leucyl aminopeptidase
MDYGAESKLKVTLDPRPAVSIDADALVSYVFESENEQGPVEGVIAELDRAAGGTFSRLAASGELTGKAGEMTLVHFAPGLAAQRVLLVGAGKRGKFGAPELRRLAATAVRYFKARAVQRVAFLARENHGDAAFAQAVTEGLILGSFDGDKYRSDRTAKPAKPDKPDKADKSEASGKPANRKVVESVMLASFDSAAQAGIDRGSIIAESQNFARELGNEPSNLLTPTMLAERAQTMAAETGLAIEILDEKRMAELKMGAILSVARGSVEPPRMIVLTYTPPAAPSAEKPGKASAGKTSDEKTTAPVLGLVGKAITFDTGGISIKPANDMEKMKFDMAGGAAMLGVMRALAYLKPPIKVIAVIPSSENMPGGRAQKPGDVQFAMSGKSIEVINTDAEGRLVLADGIAYAKQLGATHLVDAATLTGAIVVALGGVNTGVFGSDAAFTERVLASSRAAGEKMWPMPLDDEYRELINSTIADIQNVGGRWGGAISAAWFLREFTGDTPWVHLDIAGTAWLDDAKSWAGKGGTGVAVRTLVDLAMNFEAPVAAK